MTKELPYMPLGVIGGAIVAELHATREPDEKHKTLKALIEMGLERGYDMKHAYESERYAAETGPTYSALMSSPKSKKKS